MKKLLIYGCGY
ncbi:MAG: hypothetical protein GWN01_10170, partial [Nitrosopumilaceae archaeon]|nr:hypothetical protein [Nitrosopumilaceae archaeon]NIU87614.1 hypothetical protein [Nitrosopumilaceae archaeon]NIX61868.1 hypothetical protein [Nitrosopumilaceae archaeon]